MTKCVAWIFVFISCRRQVSGAGNKDWPDLWPFAGASHEGRKNPVERFDSPKDPDVRYMRLLMSTDEERGSWGWRTVKIEGDEHAGVWFWNDNTSEKSCPPGCYSSIGDIQCVEKECWSRSRPCKGAPIQVTSGATRPPAWAAPPLDPETALFFSHIPATGGTAVSWHFMASLHDGDAYGGRVASGSEDSAYFEVGRVHNEVYIDPLLKRQWHEGTRTSDGVHPLDVLAFGHNGSDDENVASYGGRLRFMTMLREPREYAVKVRVVPVFDLLTY